MALPLAALGAAACAPSGTGNRAVPVLVAIGASDAVGVGAANPDQDNWVSRLAAHLPDSARVVNLGISGATAEQAAQQELPVALDTAPTFVAVWLGVNDVQQGVPLPQFADTLRTILSAFSAQAGARVFVGNLPELETLPAFQGSDAAALRRTTVEWNASIATAAQEAGAILVDIHAAWAAAGDRDALISRDGLHPSSAGYRRIADLFWQAMQRAG
jgi:lysophospholipase L1-like esterase